MSNPDQYKRREIEKMAARAVLALEYITEQDRYKQTEPSCTDATALNFYNTDNMARSTPMCGRAISLAPRTAQRCGGITKGVKAKD